MAIRGGQAPLGTEAVVGDVMFGVVSVDKDCKVALAVVGGVVGVAVLSITSLLTTVATIKQITAKLPAKMIGKSAS